MDSFTARMQYVLDSHSVSYKAGRQSFITRCLNSGCRKEDHFYIRKSDGRSICFRCGFKANWRKIVSLICGGDFKEADSIIHSGGADGRGLPEDLFRDPLDIEEDLPEESRDERMVFGPDFVSIEKSPGAVAYLASRGVKNPAIILRYDLRYQSGMNAVVFPIRRDGVLYGWQARKIAPLPNELRLLTSVGLKKSRFLLNWDHAKTFDDLILVEGPFDCLKVDVPGFGAVASLGKGVSLSQIKMILDASFSRIYLGLDPDAFAEVYEIVSRFGLRKRIFRVLPPEGRGDFGECSEPEVLRAIDSAREVEARSDWLEAYFKQQ